MFRQPASAALASIANWLFFIIFWDIIARLVGRALGPSQAVTVEQLISQGELIRA